MLHDRAGADRARRILVARGAYHGAAPWCTPRLAGTTQEDRANLGYYTFNDLASARSAAADAGDDLAAVMVSPFKHDAGFDQELVDPAFAHGLRELCDATGAALILDDVRCGFRLHLGVKLGADRRRARPVGLEQGHRERPGAGRGAGPRRLPRRSAAGVRHRLVLVFRRADGGRHRDDQIARGGAAVEAMHRQGEALRDGILAQARSWDLAVRYTGPPVMPYLTFAGDRDHELAGVFAAQALRGGAYLHPRHNWFVSAAMTGGDLALVLEATDQAFAAVRKHLGQ